MYKKYAEMLGIIKFFVILQKENKKAYKVGYHFICI